MPAKGEYWLELMTVKGKKDVGIGYFHFAPVSTNWTDHHSWDEKTGVKRNGIDWRIRESIRDSKWGKRGQRVKGKRTVSSDNNHDVNLFMI